MGKRLSSDKGRLEHEVITASSTVDDNNMHNHNNTKKR